MEPIEKPQILIVEADNQTLQVLVEIVETLGGEPILANDGRQVLRYVEEEEDLPDLILLDVTLPDLDGYEICCFLKDNIHLQDTPVIFLTMRADPEIIVKCYAAGGADYVRKPINPVELTARIKTHLDLKESRDQLKHFNEDLLRASFDLYEAGDLIQKTDTQIEQTVAKLQMIRGQLRRFTEE